MSVGFFLPSSLILPSLWLLASVVKSLFEVVTSEASYLRSLTLLIEHFMESRELAGTILLREHRILFSNIRKVQEVSERSVVFLSFFHSALPWIEGSQSQNS